jgi:formylmethanofuran dehydrogenase subunit E
MPKIKCEKCGEEMWWGVWNYKGEKLCTWCGTPLEVEIREGQLVSAKFRGA